jgi:hypothetical protein
MRLKEGISGGNGDGKNLGKRRRRDDAGEDDSYYDDYDEENPNS